MPGTDVDNYDDIVTCILRPGNCIALAIKNININRAFWPTKKFLKSHVHESLVDKNNSFCIFHLFIISSLFYLFIKIIILLYLEHRVHFKDFVGRYVLITPNKFEEVVYLTILVKIRLIQLPINGHHVKNNCEEFNYEICSESSNWGNPYLFKICPIRRCCQLINFEGSSNQF